MIYDEVKFSTIFLINLENTTKLKKENIYQKVKGFKQKKTETEEKRKE